jgi:hypothetical protein
LGSKSSSQAAFVLKQLTALPQWRGLTITEVDPADAPDESSAFARFNEMLADALEHDGDRPQQPNGSG